MKRILVPVDFSPTSKKALRFAVDIAFRSGGVILLYHLFTPGKKSELAFSEYVNEYNKRMEGNSLKRLQRLKKNILSDTAGLPISTIVGRTPVIDNILGFAEHNHVDLIVMGTQGASGLKKVTIGSVTAKVITKSDIPVFLVPEKYELSEIEKIIFTTDFQKADNKALPVLFEFAALYGASVTFVNILHDDKSEGRKNDELVEMYAYYVQRNFNDPAVQFKQLKTNSIERTMENLQEEIPYDLLVMARRNLSHKQRFFKKSFTKKMAYVTTQPLLVIPGE